GRDGREGTVDREAAVAWRVGVVASLGLPVFSQSSEGEVNAERSRGFITCALLVAAGAAHADDGFNGFQNLSFTGDGKTPSALTLYAAQDRAPSRADLGASGGEKGDAAYAIPLTLPPAHLQPEVALTYS